MSNVVPSSLVTCQLCSVHSTILPATFAVPETPACDFKSGIYGGLPAVAAAENNSRVGLARSMANAGARAYNGGLGAEPPAGVQGAEPPVGGQGAKLP